MTQATIVRLSAKDRPRWRKAVLDDVSLSATTRNVAMVLAEFINARTGIAFPSQALLASKVQRKERAARYALTALRDAGYVAWRKPKFGSSCTYYLTLPTRSPSGSELPDCEPHQRSTDCRTIRQRIADESVARLPPNTNTEHEEIEHEDRTRGPDAALRGTFQPGSARRERESDSSLRSESDASSPRGEPASSRSGADVLNNASKFDPTENSNIPVQPAKTRACTSGSTATGSVGQYVKELTTDMPRSAHKLAAWMIRDMDHGHWIDGARLARGCRIPAAERRAAIAVLVTAGLIETEVRRIGNGRATSHFRLTPTVIEQLEVTSRCQLDLFDEFQS